MKRQISSYKGRKLCHWQKLLLSAVLAGAVTFAGLFGAVLYGSYDHIQGDPRAMVVLGCQVMPDGEPSILLRDRLDRALDYLEDHPDLTVVVSGGQGDNEPVTEARCMADYLMERGVEEDQRFWRSGPTTPTRTCAIPGSCWRQRAVICPRGWWWSPTAST